MMDKNISVLDGVIGNDYKEAKTRDNRDFVTFSLVLGAYMKEWADKTERSYRYQYIRVFVYDKKQVEYLRDVRAKKGNRVFVFGRLTSCLSEYRGNRTITQQVISRDVAIIKTPKEAKKELKEMLKGPNDQVGEETINMEEIETQQTKE